MCGVEKPVDDFYRAAGARDGHRGECKACNQAVKRERYLANREQFIEKARRWQLENPKRVREYRKERNARPEVKRRQRDAYYKRTYGITADEVDAMFADQNGQCAICRQTPERLAQMHVDHDHELGHLRGLLCSSCNQGLGQFGDDPALLLRAVVYLRQRAQLAA